MYSYSYIRMVSSVVEFNLELICMSEFFGAGVVASIKFIDAGNYKQKEKKGDCKLKRIIYNTKSPKK